MRTFGAMQVKTSRFVSSHSKVDQMPQDGRPEFAFIGRSNVGKSSLINTLTGRNELARTSGKPGKTVLVSYFLINDDWYLTDLPGYGYAVASKKTRGKWEARMTDYFRRRRTLVNAFVLIDSNVPPQRIDLEFCDWLGSTGVPFVLIFTKTDRKKARGLEQVEAFKTALLELFEQLPPIFLSSSVNGNGRAEILNFIGQTLQEIGWHEEETN